jgi:hypothetical protein
MAHGYAFQDPTELGMNNTADKMDQMVRYVARARPVQQLISDTLTQVAGVALLLMTSTRSVSLAEGSLAGAHDSALRAVEEVRALATPDIAAHHHHHMSAAATTLVQACAATLDCLRADASEHRDALVSALRASSDHLRSTARLLPGFELVDFGQACCAAHAPRRLLQDVI